MKNDLNDADREEMAKDFKMPSMDEIRKMVNSMKGLTEEQREKLRARFAKRAGFENPFADGESPSQNLDMIAPATAFEVISLVLYVIMVIAFISTFAFFGYKLYKSLTEKDRKREEKLKAKQSKKKK